MLLPVAKVLLGHYRRYPLQFVLVWLGLTLGVSLLIGVTTINYHAHLGYQQAEKLTTHPHPYQVQPKQSVDSIPYELFLSISKSGFGQCIPFAKAQVTSLAGFELSILGLPETAISTMPLNSTADRPVLSSLTVSREFSKQSALITGDYLELKSGVKLGPIIVDENNLVYGHQASAAIGLVNYLNQNTNLSMIACGDMSSNKLEKLKSILGENYTVKRNYRSELGALTQAFNMNLKAIGLLAFLVGLFIFSQAISLSFIQRQRLVGMLRQTGVARTDLSKAIIFELSIFIVISWICGNLFGLFLANQLIPTVYLSNGLPDNAGMFYGIDLWWCFYSLILTIVGALGACIWPLIRLLRSEPIRLSERLSLMRFAGSEFTLQTYIAFVLALIALALYHFGDTPESGLGVLVLILISVAFVTPFIVWKLFDFLSYRLKSVRARWFFADSAASMSYRGIATMAFLIALATNIAAETLVGSFRETTSQWLEQRLTADLYFYGTVEKSEYIDEWLRGQPEVENFWHRWETDISTTKGPMQVVSIGQSDAELNALTMKVAVPEYWQQLHNSKSVFLNESTASKLGLRPGDNIDLTSNLGKSWTVSGIYYDYSNPHFQVLIAESTWRQHFKANGDLIYAIRLDEVTNADVMRTKLKNVFRLAPERVFANSQIYNSVIGVFDKTFSVARKLGNITLLIAVCGVFFATLAGEAARQRHFTLLRFLGVSGKELIVIGSLQLLTFGLICLMIAIPLGIGLAQLILSTSIQGAFGWSIPLDYWSADFITISLWSLGTLMIAGAFPVIRLVLRSPMKVLRGSM